MLELKDKSEKGKRDDLRYVANLRWKYSLDIKIVRHLIKKHGVQVCLGENETALDVNDNLIKKILEISLDERKEIYRLLERYPDYTDEQLAKIFYKESEFYPW